MVYIYIIIKYNLKKNDMYKKNIIVFFSFLYEKEKEKDKKKEIKKKKVEFYTKHL